MGRVILTELIHHGKRVRRFILRVGEAGCSLFGTEPEALYRAAENSFLIAPRIAVAFGSDKFVRRYFSLMVRRVYYGDSFHKSAREVAKEPGRKLRQ